MKYFVYCIICRNINNSNRKKKPGIIKTKRKYTKKTSPKHLQQYRQLYYVGVHKSNNIKDDPYMGSGWIMRKLLSTYNPECFTRIILGQFYNPIQAYQLQQYIVDKDFIRIKNVINRCIGGYMGYHKTYIRPMKVYDPISFKYIEQKCQEYVLKQLESNKTKSNIFDRLKQLTSSD